MVERAMVHFVEPFPMVKFALNLEAVLSQCLAWTELIYQPQVFPVFNRLIEHA